MFFFVYEFTKGLNAKYPELYEGDGQSSQHSINFGKKWGNYATIVELAGGNILEMDKVVEEPLEKCLLYLAYRADKNQLESLLHREAIKKMG